MSALRDVMSLSRRDFELYLAGYETGYAHGSDSGREQADEEAQRLFNNAVGVVRAMARLEPWEDVQARRRQRQVETAERHTANAQPWPDDEVLTALDSSSGAAVDQ